MNKRIKAITGNFESCSKRRHSNLDFIMRDDFSWYIRIRDMEGENKELVGAEILCKMVAPPKFPFEPPEFTVLTPNGIFNTNCKVCISIGEYHKGSYACTLGMGGFAIQLMNGLICWKALESGINIIANKTSLIEKTLYSKNSKAYNRKNHAELVKEFEELPLNQLYNIFTNEENTIGTKDLTKIIMKYIGLLE